MHAATQSRRSHIAHAIAAGGLLILAALRTWPRLGSLMPACPLHQYFGVLCPGCGAARALVALLHGRVAEAWHWNALFVCVLPLALWFAGECYRRAVSCDAFRWPKLPAEASYLLLAAGGIFGIVRNLLHNLG